MAATVKIFSKVCLLIFSLLSYLENTEADRKILTVLNPNCTTKCEGGMAYVKARGDHNTLHYLLTPIGPPTVLVIMTENSGEDVSKGILVDWDKLTSDNMTEREESITLDPKLKVLYTYGIVFTRLFQYNDTADKADLRHYNVNSTAWNIYDFSKSVFTWENLLNPSSDYNIILRVMNSTDIKGQTISNGSLEFKFSFFDHMDRAADLPHLQYDDDICQFDFTLKDINTVNMSDSRFALEAVLFSTDNSKGSMKFSESKSIDDEYTPGVFKISNWLTKPEKENAGGFLQHKPVCYTKPSRGRAYATYARGYSLQTVKDVQYLLDQSVVLSYFGSNKMATLRMSATNFSFGLSEDGTFTKTNYTVWTASLGYGKPPMDAVSTLVIAVISAGLGIPVVLILFGGLFVCIKRKTDSTAVVVSNSVLPVN